MGTGEFPPAGVRHVAVCVFFFFTRLTFVTSSFALFSSFLVVSFFAFFYGSLSISGHPFDIVYTFVFFFHFVHVRSTFSGYHYRYGMDGLYYQCQGMMKGIYSQLWAAHALTKESR